MYICTRESFESFGTDNELISLKRYVEHTKIGVRVVAQKPVWPVQLGPLSLYVNIDTLEITIYMREKIDFYCFLLSCCKLPHELCLTPRPNLAHTTAFAEGGMRFRKSRPSDGLLGERAPTDSHHDGDEKLRRFQKRFYLTLAAALLTIGVSIVRHWRDGERWSMSGTGRDRGYSDGRDSVVHSAQRCTRSPLEKKDAAPKYGCQEIEVGLFVYV